MQGQLVERDALHIAEQVAEYDPDLFVQFLSECDALDQPPFRVVEHCRDGVDRVVLTAWELDGRYLQRIHMADNAAHDIDKYLTDANTKAKAAQKAAAKEDMAEAYDVAQTILKSPKQSYTVKDEKQEN